MRHFFLVFFFVKNAFWGCQVLSRKLCHKSANPWKSKPQNRGLTLLFKNSVRSLTSHRVCKHWRFVRRDLLFNHLQMTLQRQNFLLSYLNTLSAGPTYVLNPRSPALKSDAHPAEPSVVGGSYLNIASLTTKGALFTHSITWMGDLSRFLRVLACTVINFQNKFVPLKHSGMIYFPSHGKFMFLSSKLNS